MNMIEWLKHLEWQYGWLVEPLAYLLAGVVYLIVLMRGVLRKKRPSQERRLHEQRPMEETGLQARELSYHPIGRVLIPAFLLFLCVPVSGAALWFFISDTMMLMAGMIVMGLGLLLLIFALFVLCTMLVSCPICKTRLTQDPGRMSYRCPRCRIRWIPRDLRETFSGRLFKQMAIGLLGFVMVGALVAGIVTIVFGVRSFYYAFASYSWPETAGTVVESRQRRTSGTKMTLYSAHIVYDYTVDGTAYSSRRVSFGDTNHSSARHARQTVERYHFGKTVTVFYHPQNPAMAVLEPGEGGYMLIIFGLLFLTAGSGGLYFMFTQSSTFWGEKKTETRKRPEKRRFHSQVSPPSANVHPSGEEREDTTVSERRLVTLATQVTPLFFSLILLGGVILIVGLLSFSLPAMAFGLILSFCAFVINMTIQERRAAHACHTPVPGKFAMFTKILLALCLLGAGLSLLVSEMFFAPQPGRKTMFPDKQPPQVNPGSDFDREGSPDGSVDARREHTPAPETPTSPLPASEQRTQPLPASTPQTLGAYSVSGRLLFDGQPITRFTHAIPTFRLFDLDYKDYGRTQFERAFPVDYQDGHFQIRGLVEGRFSIRVELDANPDNPFCFPGDFMQRGFQFTVPETSEIVVALEQMLHLTSPQTNAQRINNRGSPDCSGVFVLQSPVHVTWESLGHDVVYHYTVGPVDCTKRRYRSEEVVSRHTTDTQVTLTLPPSQDNECYGMRLYAQKHDQQIGTLFIPHDDQGHGSWDYYFIVK